MHVVVTPIHVFIHYVYNILLLLFIFIINPLFLISSIILASMIYFIVR